ncbi:MAG: CsbD family protein [Methylococcales bacterium]|nr:CsbD family protein [Methylococcales bacterium]
MNKDQIKGRVEEAKGKVKEVTGKLLDNDDMELEGNLQKNVGKVTSLYQRTRRMQKLLPGAV